MNPRFQTYVAHSLLGFGLVLLSACAHVERESPKIEGIARYQSYLENLPKSAKERHHVKINYQGQSQNIEGVLVYRRPKDLYLRALGPMGVNLFDLDIQGNTVRYDPHIGALERPELPQFLARDLRMIYFELCPKQQQPKAGINNIFTLSCSLISPIMDRLEIDLREDATLAQKRYYSEGILHTTIDYDQVDTLGKTRLPTHIVLRGMLHDPSQNYRLEIRIKDLDLNFDPRRVFQ